MEGPLPETTWVVSSVAVLRIATYWPTLVFIPIPGRRRWARNFTSLSPTPSPPQSSVVSFSKYFGGAGLYAMTGEYDEAAEARAGAARRKIADCDSRLARYRQALGASADAAVVATWLAEVQGQRMRADQELGDQSQPTSSRSHRYAPWSRVFGTSLSY